MKKLSLLFILFFVFIISCGKTETSSTQTETSSQTAAPVEKNRVYVNADWVKSVIDGNQSQSSNYVILEASWGDPSADYKKAHIPGALHINTEVNVRFGYGYYGVLCSNPDDVLELNEADVSDVTEPVDSQITTAI